MVDWFGVRPPSRMRRPSRSTTRRPARACHGASGAVFVQENAANSSTVGAGGPSGGWGPGSTEAAGAVAGVVVGVVVGAVVAVVSGAVDSGVEVALVLGADESVSSPSDDPHAEMTIANAIAQA